MDGSEKSEIFVCDNLLNALEPEVTSGSTSIEDEVVNSNSFLEKMSNLNSNSGSIENLKDNRKRDQQYFEKLSHDDQMKKRVVSDESSNNDCEQQSPPADVHSYEMYIDPYHFGSSSECKGDDFSDSCSQSSSRSATTDFSQIERRVTSAGSTQNDSIGLNSPLSIISNNDDNRNIQSRGSSLSQDSSNLFYRENSVSSSNNDFCSTRESSASSSLAIRSSNVVIQPGEMTNELEEGPLITLPPTTISQDTSNTSLSHQNVSCESNPVSVGTTKDLQQKSSEGQNETPVASMSFDNRAKGQNTKSQSSGNRNSNAGSPPTMSNSCQAGSSTSSGTVPVENKPRIKKTPNDFIFGKVIGEGSYSTVYLAKEVTTQKEFAIKVCDKKHLIRERKTHFVMREKEVLMKLDHPFFIKLAYTFQDPDRLYYVLTYASNGELLSYLHKLSVFDVPCTRFYTAEIVLALEYLQSLNIVHRDLKPENILLNHDFHINITDFGTSKILSVGKTDEKRKNSFVGTAEYVSPEVLNNIPANFGSDLWALGCIIYQCLSGSLPFRAGNEYQTFQKIVKAEFDFPEGFNPEAKDLVTKLLVVEPTDRIGMSNMADIKNHPFYAGIDWEGLPNSKPPKLMPYLPATGNNPEFWGQDHRTGFDDQRLVEIITGQGADGPQSPELDEICPVLAPDKAKEMKRKEKLDKQREENFFHQFVEDNLILKQGFVDKRKGLFARKRMLLLTEGPHLYYVDAHNKVLKGEIPWSKDLRPEAKNFKIFFVHTPNRTYYLESRHPDAHLWVKKIEEVWQVHYGDSS